MMNNFSSYTSDELLRAQVQLTNAIQRRGGLLKVIAEAQQEEEQGLLNMSSSGRRILAEDSE